MSCRQVLKLLRDFWEYMTTDLSSIWDYNILLLYQSKNSGTQCFRGVHSVLGDSPWLSSGKNMII